MPGLDIVAPCSPVSLVWRAGAADLRLDDGRTISARLIVGADGVRSWTREAAGIRGRPARLRAVRRRRQLRHRARASRPRVAMVSSRRQRACVAAAAGQADLDRLVGAIGACRRALGAGRGGARRARCRRRRPRVGRAERDHAAAAFELSFLKLPACRRREARAGRRCGPRRAPARGPGRQSRLRGRRGARGDTRLARPGHRRRRRDSARALRPPPRRARCSRCSWSPTDWSGCSTYALRGCACCATGGCAPSVRSACAEEAAGAARATVN